MTVYEIVTRRILDSLEKGNIAWSSPYGRRLLHQNYVTQIPYKGINQLLLNTVASQYDFEYPYWITFRQLAEKKWTLQKGARAAMVTFYKELIEDDMDEEDEDNKKDKKIVLRYYNVFNIKYLTNYHEIIKALPKINAFTPSEAIEKLHKYIQKAGIKLVNQQGRRASCYISSLDKIIMVDCKSENDYIKTLAHEIIHSTAHPSRLNRQLGSQQQVYSMEELIAEIGSAMLCNALNVEYSVDNTAAYCKGWLTYLQQEKKTAIIQAASKAQKAVDYVLSIINDNNKQIAIAGT
jgi:antirestriction protein ArdC